MLKETFSIAANNFGVPFNGNPTFRADNYGGRPLELGLGQSQPQQTVNNDFKPI